MPQRVEADLTLWPAEDLAGLNDDLARTVDYSRAATLCREVAGSRPWRLIESLAEALCTALLGAYGLRSVRVALTVTDWDDRTPTLVSEWLARAVIETVEGS